MDGGGQAHSPSRRTGNKIIRATTPNRLRKYGTRTADCFCRRVDVHSATTEVFGVGIGLETSSARQCWFDLRYVRLRVEQAAGIGRNEAQEYIKLYCALSGADYMARTESRAQCRIRPDPAGRAHLPEISA